MNKKYNFYSVAVFFSWAAIFLIFIIVPVAAKTYRPITAWPIVYYRGEENFANADVLWPIFHYERKYGWQRYAFRPFIFATQKDALKDYRQTNILWQFVEYERDGSKNLTRHIFPLYWYRNSLSVKYNILAPLYWQGVIKEFSFFHIWPFFGVNRKEDFTEYSTLYPFFKYGFNQDLTEKNLDLFWPIFNYQKAKSYNSLSLFPLFTAKNDASRNYRHLNILLVLSDYERENDEYTVNVFPVYWQARKENYSYLHIWPFFGVSRDQNTKEYSTIYPFFRYSYNSKNDAVNWYAPWPIVKFNRAPDLLYFHFFPLAYISHRRLSKTDLIFPFYFKNEKDDQTLKFVTPLYLSWKTKEHSLKTLFPLYFDYQEDAFGVRVGLPFLFSFHKGPFSFSSFIPVYFHSADQELQSSFSYYFPLYGVYRRGDSVSRHLLLFPLYSKIEDKKISLKAWDFLWPFFHYESSPQTLYLRALPVYLRNRTAAYDFNTVIPFYWSFTGTGRKYLHIFPFYTQITKEDGYVKKFIFGPLYISTSDQRAGLSRMDILFPFFSSSLRKNERRSWLFPVYYHRRNPSESFTIGSLFLLPPYYYRKVRPEEKNFHLWPFYGRYQKSSYKEYSTIWPLFKFGHDSPQDYTNLNLLLFYRRREGSDSKTSFFPLWWHETSAFQITDKTLFLYNYDRAGRTKSLQLLWFLTPEVRIFNFESSPEKSGSSFFPLFFYSRQINLKSLQFLWFFTPKVSIFNFEATPENLRHSFFPLYSYKHSNIKDKDSEVSEFRFLWRLIRDYKTKDSAIFEFNPFYYYERSAREGSYWAILGGLFGLETDVNHHKKIRLFWVF